MSCDGAKDEIKNLLDYNKYEDYVDTFICPTDLKFLQVKILYIPPKLVGAGVFFAKIFSTAGH